VLFGCETARTLALLGESLGLAQAFLTVGSKSVVAATRPVRAELAAVLGPALYAPATDRATRPAFSAPASDRAVRPAFSAPASDRATRSARGEPTGARPSPPVLDLPEQLRAAQIEATKAPAAEDWASFRALLP
jgi:hypothetical protein